MKDFKKLIREAYLGNPLNEDKKPKQVNIAVVAGTDSIYSVKVEFEDGSTEKFGSEEEAEEKYNLDGVPRQEFEMDVSESVNEEDRATRVDKMLSGEYEDEDYKDSERYADVRADLEREEIEENEKFEKAARDEYGKPWMELSIAQKQELLSYMNRETEKQFQTDYEKRRRETSDYVNEGFKVGDEIVYRGGNPGKVVHVFDKKSFMNPEVEYKIRYQSDGGTTIARVRRKDIALKKDLDDMGRKYFGKDYDLDEALDPKDFPANFFYGGKIYVFDRIAGGDRAVYYNPKYNGDKLVFGSKKQMEDYLDDYVEPKGGTQSSHFGTNEGTCGYGEDGVIGDKPAGAHLQKEDMNDPVLVKARAAKMADEKEKAKQAALNKKYGSSFMDKLDAEIGLKQELQDLKDEREQLMIDMEQEAEPEGGEIADRYGSRLNDIDAKMALIKSELDDLRMYESVNEAEMPSFLTKNKAFKKAVDDSVNYNDFEKRVYHILGPKYFKLTLTQHPGVFKDYYDSIRDNKPKYPVDLDEDDELNVNVDNANDNYAKAIDAESRSGAYESLQESLRKKLRERLK